MIADSQTNLCGIIGHPVEHSMSPAIHNAAFEILGLNYAYLAFNVIDVEGAISAMRALNIRGFSVTVPHKIEVMQHLDEIDTIAEKIGAVNTIVNDNGVLKGYNTDWTGFIRSLENYTKIKNKQITILGAGGAARAIAFGIQQKGGKITILNRVEEIDMAQSLANDIDCPWGDLSDLQSIKEAEIIINATSVGMYPLANITVIDTKNIKQNQIIYDIVYNPIETKFLKEAKEIGCQIISGYEMLLLQAVAQFELWTGKTAPIDLMRKILVSRLKKE